MGPHCVQGRRHSPCSIPATPPDLVVVAGALSSAPVTSTTISMPLKQAAAAGPAPTTTPMTAARSTMRTAPIAPRWKIAGPPPKQTVARAAVAPNQPTPRNSPSPPGSRSRTTGSSMSPAVVTMARTQAERTAVGTWKPVQPRPMPNMAAR